ncbi:MAG: hypothetical protein FJ000_03920 [Actinobacteria bacterium]|nr:hypothetical protein [Actinomycetota bacterium]
MPSAPGAGLLVFCRATAPAVELLLLSGSSAATRGAYRVPSWEHERGVPAGPASEVPIEERLRRRSHASGPSPDELLETARTGCVRDFGWRPEAPFLALGGVKQHRHRLLYVWACEVDAAVASSLAGTLVAGRRAVLVDLDAARRRVVSGQRRFVDQLSALLSGDPSADR